MVGAWGVRGERREEGGERKGGRGGGGRRREEEGGRRVRGKEPGEKREREKREEG
jgi:hypothetical protein